MPGKGSICYSLFYMWWNPDSRGGTAYPRSQGWPTQQSWELSQVKVTLKGESWPPYSSASLDRPNWEGGCSSKDGRAWGRKKGWRWGFCQASKGREIQVSSQCLHQGLRFLPRPHKISMAGASHLRRVFLKPPTSKLLCSHALKFLWKVRINLPVFSPRQMQRRKTKRTRILWAQIWDKDTSNHHFMARWYTVIGCQE